MNAVDVLNQYRVTRWLWRYRWPGCPLTIALVLAMIQYLAPPRTSSWVDRVTVVVVVLALLRIWLTVLVKTERPWDERPTGIFMLVTGELIFHGVLIAPPMFGLTVPYLEWWVYALRSMLLLSALVMIFAYRDRPREENRR